MHLFSHKYQLALKKFYSAQKTRFLLLLITLVFSLTKDKTVDDA